MKEAGNDKRETKEDKIVIINELCTIMTYELRCFRWQLGNGLDERNLHITKK